MSVLNAQMAARSFLEADGRKRHRDMEAEIIQTKAHVSRLETELSELKRQEKVRRLEKPQEGSSDLATRVSQLERERKELILELNQTRKENSEMKAKWERNTSELEKLQKSSVLEKRDLRMRLAEVRPACSRGAVRTLHSFMFTPSCTDSSPWPANTASIIHGAAIIQHGMMVTMCMW